MSETDSNTTNGQNNGSKAPLLIFLAAFSIIMVILTKPIVKAFITIKPPKIAPVIYDEDWHLKVLLPLPVSPNKEESDALYKDLIYRHSLHRNRVKALGDVTYDGNLDEHREKLEKALKALNYEPLSISPTSDRVFERHEKWMEWMYSDLQKLSTPIPSHEVNYIKHAFSGHFCRLRDVGQLYARKLIYKNTQTKQPALSNAAIIARSFAVNKTGNKRVYDMYSPDLIKVIQEEELPPLIDYKVKLREYQIKRKLKYVDPSDCDHVIEAFLKVLDSKELNNEKTKDFIAKELDHIFFVFYPDQIRKVEAIIKHPRLPEYLKYFANGHLYRRKAWEERGNGRAHKVTQDGWIGFTENLKLAREALLKSWELYPKNISTVHDMIVVSMGDGKDDTRLWLNRGLNIERDNLETVWRYGLSIEPKWGGSVEEMTALAISLALAEKHDSYLSLYCEVVGEKIANTLEHPMACYENPLLSWLILESQIGKINGKKCSRLEYMEPTIGMSAYLAGEFSLLAKYFRDANRFSSWSRTKEHLETHNATVPNFINLGTLVRYNAHRSYVKAYELVQQSNFKEAEVHLLEVQKAFLKAGYTTNLFPPHFAYLSNECRRGLLLETTPQNNSNTTRVSTPENKTANILHPQS